MDEPMRHCDRVDDRAGAGIGYQTGAARADAPTGIDSHTGKDGGGRQDLESGDRAESGIGYQLEGEPTGPEQQGRASASMQMSGCGKEDCPPSQPDDPQEEQRNAKQDKKLKADDGGGGNKKAGKRGEKRPRASTHRPSDVLSERERRFVDAYCGPAKGNAREAARQAGYHHSHRSADLMKRERVRQEIARRIGDGTKRNSDALKRQWWAWIEADYADYAGLIGVKTTAKAKAELAKLRAEGKTLAIRRLRTTRWGLDVELEDKAKASELLGKHLGMLRDQVEVTVTESAIDGAAQRRLLADPQACELAATLDARLALPSPDSPASAEKGSGLPSEEPVDVEWSNLPGEPDKPV
jgi:phage terminase small subunit